MSEINLLVLRICFASIAAWLYPNAFWHGENNNESSSSLMEGKDSYSLQRPPLALFALHDILYLVIRTFFFYKSNKRFTFSADERKAKPQLPKWISVAAILGTLVNLFASSAVLALPGWVSFADISYSNPVEATACGAAASVCGLSIMFLSLWHLGESWSSFIETKTDHKLVTHGVYAYLRHPMYLAFLVSAVAHWLLSANWLSGGSYAMLMIAVAGRIPTEEAMMKEEFGSAYEEYCARTPALIPRILPRGFKSSKID